jgi:hypothetical protein
MVAAQLTQRRINPMRVSSHNEARQGFLAAALSVPLAVVGAVLSVGLFGTVV